MDDDKERWRSMTMAELRRERECYRRAMEDNERMEARLGLLAQQLETFGEVLKEVLLEDRQDDRGNEE